MRVEILHETATLQPSSPKDVESNPPRFMQMKPAKSPIDDSEELMEATLGFGFKGVSLEHYKELYLASDVPKIKAELDALGDDHPSREALVQKEKAERFRAELEIAANLQEAEALEGRAPTDPNNITRLRVTEDGRPDAVLGLVEAPNGRFYTRPPKRAEEDNREYGWGRKSPHEPCQRKGGLPRWCLLQRNIADPRLPDPRTESSLTRYLRKDKKRLRLFGVGLTAAQIREAISFLEAGSPLNILRRVKRWLFQEAEDANKDKSITSEEVQILAEQLFEDRWTRPETTNQALLKQLLAGLSPCRPESSEQGPVVCFRFERFEREGPYELPDVKVDLESDFRSIRGIHYRFFGEPKPTYVPVEDSDDLWTPWGHAKRLARMAAFVYGQYEGHVASHLLLESLQIALARQESISKEVRSFLHGFVNGVAEINNYGNGLIVGDSGILCRGTGLSPEGALAYAAEALGRHDWKGFSPRAPLFADDVFAAQANVYWQFVQRLVRQAMPDFEKHRSSYRSLVNEVVEYSVPCTAPDAARFIENVRSEIPLPPTAEHRRKVNGSARAISPIDFSGPTAEDDTVAFLSYFIFQGSFIHTWANDQQRDFGGDLRLCPLGVRGRKAPESEAEFWRDVAPLPPEAAMQLFLSDALTRIDTPRMYETGFFPGSRSEPWMKYVDEAREDFKRVGIQIEEIRRAPAI